ncbi:MAG: YhbY family RNA-binding protein [Bacilli bacterium]|nr:YhbY family RNA-binding protein [Bacilli bacterium]
MLTKEQKKFLKAYIVSDKTKYQIGKSEITDSALNMLDKALDARELIRIEVLKNATTPIMELTLDLSSKLHAEVVSVVGRVIILFRRNKENPKIKIK